MEDWGEELKRMQASDEAWFERQKELREEFDKTCRKQTICMYIQIFCLIGLIITSVLTIVYKLHLL